MVDVSGKAVTAREAVARGRIRISAAAMRRVRSGKWTWSYGPGGTGS